MLYKKKIRLMTKLAIYDKKYGAVDKKISDCFKWDYIYFRNFSTRAGVLFGCVIIAALYALKKIVVDEIDVFSLDLRAEAAKIGFYTVAALVVYTIIGTLVARKEYTMSKERLEAYFIMLGKLDRLSEERKASSGEGGVSNNGSAPPSVPFKESGLNNEEKERYFERRRAVESPPPLNEKQAPRKSQKASEILLDITRQRSAENNMQYSGAQKGGTAAELLQYRKNVKRAGTSEKIGNIHFERPAILPEKNPEGGAGYGENRRYKGTDNNNL